MAVTFFGEITELDSRAVWYSDEEDHDDDFDEDDGTGSFKIDRNPSLVDTIEPTNIKKLHSSILFNFISVSYELSMKFSSCIISLSSSAAFKNFKLGDNKSLPLLGYFEPSLGKLFAFRKPNSCDDEYLLWIMLDSSHNYISGQHIGFFVEALREKLKAQFNLLSSCSAQSLIILSKQFSKSDNLEYLANYPVIHQLPFNGYPLRPPSLIKNQFESALLEQLTMVMQPALIVCLPDPKNCWFDANKNWSSLPTSVIIDHRLNDDSLENTLIFT